MAFKIFVKTYARFSSLSAPLTLYVYELNYEIRNSETFPLRRIATSWGAIHLTRYGVIKKTG